MGAAWEPDPCPAEVLQNRRTRPHADGVAETKRLDVCKFASIFCSVVCIAGACAACARIGVALRNGRPARPAQSAFATDSLARRIGDLRRRAVGRLFPFPGRGARSNRRDPGGGGSDRGGGGFFGSPRGRGAGGGKEENSGGG